MKIRWISSYQMKKCSETISCCRSLMVRTAGTKVSPQASMRQIRCYTLLRFITFQSFLTIEPTMAQNYPFCSCLLFTMKQLTMKFRAYNLFWVPKASFRNLEKVGQSMKWKSLSGLMPRLSMILLAISEGFSVRHLKVFLSIDRMIFLSEFCSMDRSLSSLK